MPSHESRPPANPARRARLRAGLGLLAAGLPMMSGLAAAAPAVALPAPPVGAQAVDWDHFGEPSLSAARRADAAVTRSLKASAPDVDTQLYRLPGDVDWDQVLRHYRQGAGNAWKALAGADRVETGNPARQQRFAAVQDERQGFAVVWLPPASEVRDGLLMVLTIAPAR